MLATAQPAVLDRGQRWMISIIRFLGSHPLTRDDLPRALLRFARYQWLTRTRAQVEMPWVEGTRLLVRKHMPGASGNLYAGLHEYSEMGFLLHFLRPGDLFVDVGANVGTWSVLASGVCGARTVAFEPDPQTVAHLRANIAANKLEACVRIEQAALGAWNGDVDFTVGRDTMNHIATSTDAQIQRVSLRRLDNMVTEAPAFLKMDVEGFEEGVVDGSGDLLVNPVLQAVSTELASPAIVGALKAAGLIRAYYDPILRLLSREPNGIATNNSLFVRDFAGVQARLSAAPLRRIYNWSL